MPRIATYRACPAHKRCAKLLGMRTVYVVTHAEAMHHLEGRVGG